VNDVATIKTKEMTDLQPVKTLRLILGDQLNSSHSWFALTDPNVTYVMMELRSETDYVVHHVQKVLGFFAAMRRFSDHLRSKGHQVIYMELNDPENLQSFSHNVRRLIDQHAFSVSNTNCPMNIDWMKS
jgi:deoxyribodipyrimidine photolyase-related protein